jgi:hypothetical protein
MRQDCAARAARSAEIERDSQAMLAAIRASLGGAAPAPAQAQAQAQARAEAHAARAAARAAARSSSSGQPPEVAASASAPAPAPAPAAAPAAAAAAKPPAKEAAGTSLDQIGLTDDVRAPRACRRAQTRADALALSHTHTRTRTRSRPCPSAHPSLIFPRSLDRSLATALAGVAR